MIYAEQRMCTCNKEVENNESIVGIDCIEIDHELMNLYGYYCIDCNSFWREP